MPERLRILVDALDHHAENRGSAPAIELCPDDWRYSSDGTLCWSELARWVYSTAELLAIHADGGQRIIHSINNTVEDILVGLACQVAGLTEVPIDAAAGTAYRDACRDQVDAYWLDDELKPDLFDRASRRVDRNVPHASQFHGSRSEIATRDALILWTSGTQGAPKGVVLSNRSLAANAKAKLAAAPQSTSDRRLTVLSIAHAYARTCDLGTWLLSGCTLTIARGYEGWMERHSEFKPTLCNVVPSVADRILSQPNAATGLRLLGCGGAAMASQQFERFREIGVTVIQGYGLTETGPVISSQTPDDSIPGHCGRFVAGWEHRIHDGRLYVRGEHLMSRYWNSPDLTAARIDNEGWLDTGDLVHIDDTTGQLEILGRCDDRIVLSNGHNVDPMGLEKRIEALSSVQSAIIVPSSDGRSVDLWIEAAPGRSFGSDVQELAKTLPKWERPKQFHPLAIPDGVRPRLFNRKGAVRRAEMLRFIATQSGDS